MADGNEPALSWWTQKTRNGGTRRFSAILGIACLLFSIIAWSNGEIGHVAFTQLNVILTQDYISESGLVTGVSRLLVDIFFLGIAAAMLMILFIICPIMFLYCAYDIFSSKSSKVVK
jgi:hypothetical protein